MFRERKTIGRAAHVSCRRPFASGISKSNQLKRVVCSHAFRTANKQTNKHGPQSKSRAENNQAQCTQNCTVYSYERKIFSVTHVLCFSSLAT